MDQPTGDDAPKQYPPDRHSARLLGSLKYFTGRPCSNRHISPRYTSNGACIECLGLQAEKAAQGERVRDCRQHGRYSQRQCPACKREWTKQRPPSPEVRAKLAEIQRIRTAACRAFVRKIKSEPCIDCGQRYPWYVMEFDHRNGRRAENGDCTVASLVSQGRLERIEAEIAKCDLVCSNCHKIRTHERAVALGLRIV